MFGYVNVYKNELKIKDYNLFRAYYCGLCKSLGKYNQLVRFGLSYDMTFLSIITDSLNDTKPDIKKDGCIKHIGKHEICQNNDAIKYSADMSIILMYHKLCDDIKDNHSIKAFFAKLAYVRAFKKASRKYEKASAFIKEMLSSLTVLEKEKCPYVDISADPFAKLLQMVFSTYDESLGELGYNIGRFIYIVDAYKDLESDLKSNSYNPYIYAYDNEFLKSEEFKDRVKGSLNMTLYAIAESYKKLNIQKNKEILDNIIYLGLRYVSENLFNELEVNHE